MFFYLKSIFCFTRSKMQAIVTTSKNKRGSLMNTGKSTQGPHQIVINGTVRHTFAKIDTALVVANWINKHSTVVQTIMIKSNMASA